MPRLLRIQASAAAGADASTDAPALVEDGFTWIRESALDVADLPEGPLIVPLALWQTAAAELVARGAPLGVWLDAHEEAEALAEDLPALALVGIHFPLFSDGRGLSTAALLRTRFGFTGELRALGDVQRDQLSYMRRCGIDAFCLGPDQDAEQAAAGLRVMTRYYQGDALDPRPLFRRERLEVDQPETDAA